MHGAEEWTEANYPLPPKGGNDYQGRSTYQAAADGRVVPLKSWPVVAKVEAHKEAAYEMTPALSLTGPPLRRGHTPDLQNRRPSSEITNFPYKFQYLVQYPKETVMTAHSQNHGVLYPEKGNQPDSKPRSWWASIVNWAVSVLGGCGKFPQSPLRDRPVETPHKENEICTGPSINSVGTPFAEKYKKFNINDLKELHATACLATFAWGLMLNSSASIQQVLEYINRPCSCRQKQHRADQPGITYEELLAEALHDLRKGSPAKAQALFLKTATKREKEAKAALRDAAEVRRSLFNGV